MTSIERANKAKTAFLNSDGESPEQKALLQREFIEAMLDCTRAERDLVVADVHARLSGEQRAEIDKNARAAVSSVLGPRENLMGRDGSDPEACVKNAIMETILDGPPGEEKCIVDTTLRAVVTHVRESRDATFEYVNHAGVRETRHVADLQRPEWRAEVPWYPQPVWLIRGRCLARNAERSFECAKIENIRPLAAGLLAQSPDSNR